MKKFTKFVLTSATIAVAAGIVLSGIGFAVNGAHNINIIWDKGFKFAGDKELETLEKTTLDSFSNMNIDVDAAKIYFKQNDSDEYAIEYKLYSSGVKCEVKNDTLLVEQNPEQINFNFNFFNFPDVSDCYLTVYYPEGCDFDSIKVDSSAGAINAVEGLNCSLLDMDSSAGAIKLDGFKGAITVDSSAGAFEAKNSEFTKVTMDMSAGGITFINCTIGGGKIDSSAGGLEAKDLILKGDLSCDMSAGSVDIELVDGDAIGFDFDVSAGSIKIDGKKVASNDDYNENTNADVVLTVDSSAGSIAITHK